MREPNHLSVWVSNLSPKDKDTDGTIDYFNHVIWIFLIYTHFSYAYILYTVCLGAVTIVMSTQINHCQVEVEHDTN